MTGQRPFRFGVQLTSEATSREAWRAHVRKAEDLGYDIVTVPDHIGNRFAYGPALAVAAEATSRLRIGTFVLDNDFRHPVLMAGEAATLDLLSGGRFELGLGAGWMLRDYELTGIPFDPPSVRVDRFVESVTIAKAFLAGETLDFAGTYYTITNLDGFPRPVQQPRPPLLIGGGGKRMLTIAAREADIIGVIPKSLPDGSGLDIADTSAAATRQKITWMRQAAGNRFPDLELNLLLQRVIVTDQPGREAEELGRQWSTPTEHMLETPHVLIGTIEHMVETLQARREEYGISYLVIFEPEIDTFAPIVSRLAGK